MQKLSRLAAAATLLVGVPLGLALAQTAPAAGTEPAASPAPAAAAPATPPASPPQAAAPAASQPATTTNEQTTATKKKKPVKMTRRQEIDRSIDSGTVPARYRKQVPKEYQQYVPFAK